MPRPMPPAFTPPRCRLATMRTCAPARCACRRGRGGAVPRPSHSLIATRAGSCTGVRNCVSMPRTRDQPAPGPARGCARATTCRGDRATQAEELRGPVAQVNRVEVDRNARVVPRRASAIRRIRPAPRSFGAFGGLRRTGRRDARRIRASARGTRRFRATAGCSRLEISVSMSKTIPASVCDGNCEPPRPRRRAFPAASSASFSITLDRWIRPIGRSGKSLPGKDLQVQRRREHVRVRHRHAGAETADAE